MDLIPNIVFDDGESRVVFNKRQSLKILFGSSIGMLIGFGIFYIIISFIKNI